MIPYQPLRVLHQARKPCLFPQSSALRFIRPERNAGRAINGDLAKVHSASIARMRLLYDPHNFKSAIGRLAPVIWPNVHRRHSTNCG